MNKLFSALSAFGAGLLVMYFYDQQSGRRRRAVLRDQALAAARRRVWRGEKQARHMANQARGVWATGHFDRHSRRAPEDDRQLHERIRAQMGHMVSHPGAVEVQVEHGQVTLSGHVLRHEIQSLLDCVQAIPGVHRLDNRLIEHEQAGNIPGLQGGGLHESAQPRMRQEPHPQDSTAWH